MKKLNRPLELKLPTLDIYADDIKEICELIKKNYQHIDLRVTTKDEDYELEAEDINKLEGFHNISRLYISGYNKSEFSPEVDIALSRSPLYISQIKSFNSNDYVSRGIVDTLRGMLLKRKNRVRSLLTSQFLWIPILLLVVFHINFIPKNWELPLSSYPLIVFATIGVYLTARFLTPHAVIIGVQKKELPSYWKRQKDYLITACIAAVIGAAIGALITYYLTRP